MPDPNDGCVVPAQGPLIPETEPQAANQSQPSAGGKSMVSVGKPAPDFEASAFFEGGFKNIKLSDFQGQWVLLCFYPGDFTFV